MSETMNNIEKLKEAAEDAVAATNEAISNDSYLEIGKAKSAMTAAIAALNDAVIKEAFREFLSDGPETAILKALTQGYLTIYRAKPNRDKNTGIETFSLDKKDNEVVNLIDLEKQAAKKCFHDGQWIYYLEAFTAGMTRKAVMEIGNDAEKERVKSEVKLSETARKCDIGKDPTSYSSLTKALQGIIDGIIYEDVDGKNKYKVTSQDVKYIIYLAFRRGKGKLSISVPRESTMIMLVTEIAHRLVTNGEFTFEYAKK